MTEQICAACPQPTRNGFICAACTAKLRRDLYRVPGLLIELETTETRNDRLGSGQATAAGTYNAEDRPVAWNEDATEARWQLRNTLEAWANSVREHRAQKATPNAPERPQSAQNAEVAQESRKTVPGPQEGIQPETTSIELAIELVLHLGDIRKLPDAGECLDEIAQARKTAMRVVDAKPARIYLGQCDNEKCQADLYARPKQDSIECDCGRAYDVEERREANRATVRERLFTAREIEQDVGHVFGVYVRATRIRVWACRDEHLIKGQDRETGENLFQLGEILTRHARFVETRESGKRKAGK